MKMNTLLAVKLLIVIIAVILACLAYLRFMAPHQAPAAPPAPPPAAANSNTGIWQDTQPKQVTIPNPFGSANK
jgi:hypothetical protein